jgi:hypothetical protein
MPVNYTDLFNTCLDTLSSTLSTVTGLQVVTDPRNLVPPCVLIGAPSFTAFNYNAVRMTYPLQIVTLGPSNLDAMRSLLNMCALILSKNVAVTEGNPTTLEIGGVNLPAYNLTVEMRSSTT